MMARILAFISARQIQIRSRDANSNTYDTILIGGGPAGSSAAAILAEYGHRVLILEREKFPRYHIGESLIPFTFEPLERIGMIPKMKASHFVKKYSVAFVQPDGKRSQPFYFFNRYDRETVAQTWQVLRSEFDQMLLDNAREKGAEVREETTVNRLAHGGRAASSASRADGQGWQHVRSIARRITLDCTGKEAFTADTPRLAHARSVSQQDRGLDLLQGLEARAGHRRRRRRPWPTCRTRAGSGTSRSTTTWSASASWPRANTSPAAA